MHDSQRIPVNLSELRKCVSRETLEILITHILQDYPETLDQIRRGVANGEAGRVRTLCHSLKSSLGHLGSDEAHLLAGELEELAAAADLGRAEETLLRLDKEVKRVIRYFSETNTSWRKDPS